MWTASVQCDVVAAKINIRSISKTSLQYRCQMPTAAREFTNTKHTVLANNIIITYLIRDACAQEILAVDSINRCN